MQRICSRALALLICAMMFVGLIGARPLSPATERNLLGAASISLLPAQSFATAPPAGAQAQAKLPSPQADNRSQKDELMAELRSAAPVERFQAMSVVEPVPVAKPVPAMIAGKGPSMRGELVAQTQRL